MILNRLTFLITSICCCLFILACSSGGSDSNEFPVTKNSPAFKDSGNTIRRLLKEYKCERIEFENWEEDDLSDSSLTVCFINSKVLSIPAANEDAEKLNDVARKIKAALSNPAKYFSYYIIFVKEQTDNGISTRSHSFGGAIRSQDL